MTISVTTVIRTTAAALLLAVTATLPIEAFAYVGPGLAVGAIWVFVGPIAALVVLVGLVAYFPIRYWLKKRARARRERGEPAAGSGGSDREEDGGRGH